MKKIMILFSITLTFILSGCSHNSKSSTSITSTDTSIEISTEDTEDAITMEEAENIKKIGRYDVYQTILDTYNEQAYDIHKVNELTLANRNLHKSGVRMSTVEYDRKANVIVGFNEDGIQAFLVKNTASLEFVEKCLSNLLNTDITIKDEQIIGTDKFYRAENYPNDTREFYIPIVTDEVNYYPEDVDENWANDFFDFTVESSVNNITEDE